MAIVGGGITGALIADRLVQEGVDTVLIDKRLLATGSTAASTGLLQYEIDTPLVDLIRKVGQRHASHAYRRGLAAIDQIEQLTQELGEACGFERRESLYFASHWWHVRRLKREYECRKLLGFQVDFLQRDELAAISSIKAPAAIRSHGDAQIDPYRFTKRLIERCADPRFALLPKPSCSMCGKWLKASFCARRREPSPPSALSLPRAMIHTGSYLIAGTLHTTYALCSEILTEFPGWPNGALIWETARPYFYARQTPDGRALIGGEDTSFSGDHQRDGLLKRQSARLQDASRSCFPSSHSHPHLLGRGFLAKARTDWLTLASRQIDPMLISRSGMAATESRSV